MKAKISQKCPPNQGEEGFLAKCFRFFDIHNKGEVNFEQFFRTVEKIGVIIEKQVCTKCFEFFYTGLREDFQPLRLEWQWVDGLQGVLLIVFGRWCIEVICCPITEELSTNNLKQIRPH